MPFLKYSPRRLPAAPAVRTLQQQYNTWEIRLKN